MMDLSGIGSGVLDKIEEHWGKRVSRTLSFLIALALVSVCIALIWTWLVTPILAFFKTPVWGQTLTQLALTAVAIGGGISLSFSLSQALARRRQLRALKKLRDDSARDYEKVITEAKEAIAGIYAEARRETDELFAEARQKTDEIYDSAGEKADEFVEMARDLAQQLAETYPNLTDEQRAELFRKLDFQQEADGEEGDRPDAGGSV